MAKHEFNSGDTRKFILTAFFAFVAVFVFLSLMRLWEGDYQVDSSGKISYETRTVEP